MGAIMKLFGFSWHCNLWALFASILMLAMPVSAQERIIVEKGKGIFLPSTGAVDTVFVADTGIADVTSSPGESVFLFGKSIGETTLIAIDLSGKELFRSTVAVVLNLQEIGRSLNERFSGQQISISSARGSIMIDGVVSNERVRQDVLTTVSASVPDSALIDRLTVANSNLIRLDVALYEVNRSRVEAFGINWSALVGSGSGGNLANVTNALNLLVSNGVASIVTETSMTTISGKSANFSVGGEVPIPTFSEGTDTDSGNFSLSYKFIGMNLDFAPEQINEEKLRLEIASTISSTQSATASVNGNSFPTLSSRQFQTTVELRDRQSFVIAGLSKEETFASLKDRRRNNPFAGLLRTIFGNESASRTRQELIIVVTPQFKSLEAPTILEQLTRPASNLEYILSRRTGGGKPTGDSPRIEGPAGFSY
jgi:pilus assembly protein CpaC